MCIFFCRIHFVYSVCRLQGLELRTSPDRHVGHFRAGQFVEAHPRKSRRLVQEVVGEFSEGVRQEQFDGKVVSIWIKTVISC